MSELRRKIAIGRENGLKIVRQGPRVANQSFSHLSSNLLKLDQHSNLGLHDLLFSSSLFLSALGSVRILLWFDSSFHLASSSGDCEDSVRMTVPIDMKNLNEMRKVKESKEIVLVSLELRIEMVKDMNGQKKKLAKSKTRVLLGDLTRKWQHWSAWIVKE